MPKLIKEGIILYSIEKDNCLNGVYTNEHATPAPGTIRNEIAIKNSGASFPDLIGIYNVMYFDDPTTRQNGVLKIDLLSGVARCFRFQWDDISGIPIFEGRGYQMNAHQIAVHYWTVDKK